MTIFIQPEYDYYNFYHADDSGDLAIGVGIRQAYERLAKAIPAAKRVGPYVADARWTCAPSAHATCCSRWTSSSATIAAMG